MTDHKQRFLADVANHRMEIVLDNGLHRHLKFMAPRNSNQWFEIVTWPGSLSLNGDMGSWTFSRVPDMFTFFRGDGINPHYWAEKLQAEDYRTGAREFSVEAFRKQVMGQLDDYGLPFGVRTVVESALNLEVFCNDNEHDLRVAWAGFKHYSPDFEFDISEQPDGMEWTGRFLWCLWAIVWGIQQYDAILAKAGNVLKNEQ